MDTRLLGTVAALLGSSLALPQTPCITTKILMKGSLGETSEPKMSLSILDLAPGETVPAHSHTGAVFAYVLEGSIENQIEQDARQIFLPGGFFHERPMHIHRLLRNTSATRPARLLRFQNTGTLPAGCPLLLWEALPGTRNLQVTVTRLFAGPGAEVCSTHTGLVFTYVLKNQFESRLDATPSKLSRAGDALSTPRLNLRNPSATEFAELLILEATAEKN